MTDSADTARLRQGLYRYFGEALLPPDHGRLATIGAAGDYLAAAGIEAFPFYSRWEAFRAAADPVDGDRLAAEYVTLFASGVGGTLCPPTESYYLGEARGGRIARIVAAVEQEYRNQGLSVTNGSEPPDHITTELEAMSMLCAREAVARESDSAPGTSTALLAEDRLLRRHLALWLSEFRERVARAAEPTGFYGTLVEAIYAFVIHDVDFVALLRRRLDGVTV